MKQLCVFFLSFLLSSIVVTSAFPYGVAPQATETSDDKFPFISGIVGRAIAEGRIPGALIVIGNQERIIYKKAFGSMSLEPDIIPMREDAIFDIASITKVVATATAIMQLAEKGKMNIDAPAWRYWPEFKSNGKKNITVRQLLTHYSGLRAELGNRPGWSGYEGAMKKIISERPKFSPGARFLYSDVNFQILGELVRRVSGKALDEYTSENIFKPLGMNDTGFMPSRGLLPRIAPTEYLSRSGKILCGEVHDPMAQKMGGVAGHAGLFSSGDDLSIFATMILNSGSYNGKKILSAESVKKMTSPQSPKRLKVLRGLGWDIDSPFSGSRGEFFPIGSFGHTGYTGTSIWIDPFSKTYVIILTNRVHPYGKGDAKKLYKEIATAVAGSVTGRSIAQARKNVQPGIDVLTKERFLPL